ncbi:molybdopterin-guanine dinucleotide biosynthesis protein B [Paraburkholderia aspalathi]|nr:molybdopterin-guanine dinucleotide biosynthesis protein B [Paraburkholderia aspalathi]
MKPKLFGITGWKKSGKTTLTEKLVAELIGRGFRISTIKHAHHDFDIDHEGTDSWRHRKAGAGEVAIVSSRRFAIMHECGDEDEPSLDEIAAKLSPCDLVLVEGYKRGPHKKIEARRTQANSDAPLAPNDANIVAIATDFTINDANLPIFGINDIVTIADFVEVEMRLRIPGRLNTNI